MLAADDIRLASGMIVSVETNSLDTSMVKADNFTLIIIVIIKRKYLLKLFNGSGFVAYTEHFSKVYKFSILNGKIITNIISLYC